MEAAHQAQADPVQGLAVSAGARRLAVVAMAYLLHSHTHRLHEQIIKLMVTMLLKQEPSSHLELDQRSLAGAELALPHGALYRPWQPAPLWQVGAGWWQVE